MRYSAEHRVPSSTRIGGRMLRQPTSSGISSRITSAVRDISAAIAAPRRRELRRGPSDPEIVQARSAVVVSGLPKRAVRTAERGRGRLDWRPLAAALDSLYIAKGGAPGVRIFLTTPQRSLSGGVPAEMIAHKGELQRVAMAAYRESVRAQATRTR